MTLPALWQRLRRRVRIHRAIEFEVEIHAEEALANLRAVQLELQAIETQLDAICAKAEYVSHVLTHVH